jgi:hypothetical protein
MSKMTLCLVLLLIFSGCFIISIAVGQIVNDAAWAAVCVGASLVLVGTIYALASKKK